jgi:hypothetical protein
VGALAVFDGSICPWTAKRGNKIRGKKEENKGEFSESSSSSWAELAGLTSFLPWAGCLGNRHHSQVWNRAERGFDWEATGTDFREFNREKETSGIRRQKGPPEELHIARFIDPPLLIY